ncbi:hypothetical protein LVJ94_25815 [Pendulispora rubella]|uniref:Hint domain-containing protein n=1 Tax=Pendulispora rubella TaxID=2741070 RepID=A0ABZ2LN72_9BACT
MNIKLLKTIVVTSTFSLIATACAATNIEDAAEDAPAASTQSAVVAAAFPQDFPPFQDPNCPGAAPANADWTVFACKAWEQTHDSGGSHPATRCFSALSQEECDAMIDDTFNQGLMNTAARDWTRYWHWCPMVIAGKVRSICPVGCFASDTQLATGGVVGEVAINQVNEGTQLLTLDEGSALRTPNLVSTPVEMSIKGPEMHDLVTFDLANGRELSVTEEHPMVLASGQIVKAKNVAAEDSFVGSSGSSVAIHGIYRTPAVGDVYNVKMHTRDLLGHIVVAEGVLAGDNELQAVIGSEEEKAIQLRAE